MGVEIKSEHIDIGGSNVVLASVRGGKAVIGTCSAGYGAKRGDTSAQTRLFYIGNDPVAEILCPNHGSKSSDTEEPVCLPDGPVSGLSEKIWQTVARRRAERCCGLFEVEVSNGGMACVMPPFFHAPPYWKRKTKGEIP